MSKLIVLIVFLIAASTNVEAQAIKFGVKAGANFSDFEGNDINTSTLTSYHFGALVEIKVFSKFAIQPEAMFSSQGAKVEGSNDFKLDYINVPVLAKFYLISDRLSLDVGPQFGFLVDDNVAETFETESFDFAAVGGIGLNITKNLFAQARYVVGLTEMSKEAEVKNKVIQLSVGYTF
ncbi:porin family protein [Flavobacterium sp.]|uniref:porin family protein n=1 Tax=Flavobacterium sp. TaxID=239 RepID=UPI002B4AB962|nr:porin family protein [Flavobacterium sp.]HLF53512.1 porin family protein [Flavobacterium sp.]